MFLIKELAPLTLSLQWWMMMLVVLILQVFLLFLLAIFTQELYTIQPPRPTLINHIVSPPSFTENDLPPNYQEVIDNHEAPPSYDSINRSWLETSAKSSNFIEKIVSEDNKHEYHENRIFLLLLPNCNICCKEPIANNIWMKAFVPIDTPKSSNQFS